MTIRSGTRLGPYEILAPLGAGGMGEVYRARDTRLDREVAVKVLSKRLAGDSEMRSRFEREAKAVAALSHANILAIHDVGAEGAVSYAVMELLEGETLRERINRSALSWRKATEIGSAIADGLAAGHARGIIHRDIKPDNLFVTRDGVVKILDFGLARMDELAATSDPGTTPTLTLDTRRGSVMGTAAYMSPEQVRGDPADARSDIFSLGCVLYELAVGERAFSRDTAAETMTAILKEEPPVLAVPDQSKLSGGLERIVARCLEKKPEHRFQSASDLAFQLRNLHLDSGGAAATPARATPSGYTRWVVATVILLGAVAALVVVRNRAGQTEGITELVELHPVKSIAVLPLVNLSGNPDQDYVADSMTEALISDLSKIGQLRVISRRSVMRFKSTNESLAEIARKLGVDAVLEGSVLRSGDRIRITARLIEPVGETHLWSDRYEREFTDILSLQNEVARDIAVEIQVTLTPREDARLAGADAVNPKAHEAYMRGRYFLQKATEKSLLMAREYFEEAIETDPGFALAYAGLADAYIALASDYWAPKETMPPAREAALKALELDELLAEAHTALGTIKLKYEWDWEGAESELLRAIELNPNLADAHLEYAEYLTAMGRTDEALAEMKRGEELDPLSPISSSHIAMILVVTRQFDRALEYHRESVDLDPSFWSAHRWLGMALAWKGRFGEAIAALRQARAWNDSPRTVALLGTVYGMSGDSDKARKIIDELLELREERYVCPYEIATVFITLGQYDEALKWLELACEERADCMPWAQVDPFVDPLRGDPRFDEILRCIGFEPPPRPASAETSSGGKTMLAVLPFENASDDPDAQYLCDEIPASIIDRLAALESLRVVPRSTAFRYDAGDQDTARIGRGLNANVILTGQINARGDTLRIRTELIDVSDSRRLWSERYDRTMDEILNIEDDISDSIALALQVQISGAQRSKIKRRYTDNADAYAAYLRARFWFAKRTEEGIDRAITAYDEAIAMAPEFALAYAGKAETLVIQALTSQASGEVIPSAREAAERALSLDPLLAEAHIALGAIQHFYDWDYDAAERSFLRAIELNPQLATPHQYYGHLISARDPKKAIAVHETAVRLDPGSLIYNTCLGHTLAWAGEADKAFEQYRRTLDMDPSYPAARNYLGRLLAAQGSLDEAIGVFETFEREVSYGYANGDLGWAYGLAGRKSEAHEELRKLLDRSKTEYVPAQVIAKVYAGLGDKKNAIDWLEKACERREAWLVFIEKEPHFHPLHGDPGFEAIVKRIGLNQ